MFKRIPAFLSTILAVAILIACACGAAAEATEPTLADWAGTWNSAESYLSDEAVQQALAGAAEGMGMKPEEVQAMYAAMMGADGTGSFVIDGDTITAYSLQNGEGDVLFTASFTYAGTETVEGEMDGVSFTMDWYKYTLRGDGPEDYAFLALSAAHSDTEDSMVHFHYRYGGESFEALTDMSKNWYPTMCENTVTAQELAEELLEEGQQD